MDLPVWGGKSGVGEGGLGENEGIISSLRKMPSRRAEACQLI